MQSDMEHEQQAHQADMEGAGAAGAAEAGAAEAGRKFLRSAAKRNKDLIEECDQMIEGMADGLERAKRVRRIGEEQQSELARIDDAFSDYDALKAQSTELEARIAGAEGALAAGGGRNDELEREIASLKREHAAALAAERQAAADNLASAKSSVASLAAQLKCHRTYRARIEGFRQRLLDSCERARGRCADLLAGLDSGFQQLDASVLGLLDEFQEEATEEAHSAAGGSADGSARSTVYTMSECRLPAAAATDKHANADIFRSWSNAQKTEAVLEFLEERRMSPNSLSGSRVEQAFEFYGQFYTWCPKRAAFVCDVQALLRKFVVEKLGVGFRARVGSYQTSDSAGTRASFLTPEDCNDVRRHLGHKLRAWSRDPGHPLSLARANRTKN